MRYFSASGEHVLAHLTTRNTFFSLCLWQQNGVFFPKDRTHRAFFVVFNKTNFFLMVPTDLNAFLSFVQAAETANSRFGNNSAPKSVAFLSIAKFYKNSAKMIFFVPQRNLRCFYAGAVAPKRALFHQTPLKTEISTLSTKWQTFYRLNIFSDSSEAFAFFGGPLGNIFNAPEHAQHPF